MQNYYQSDEERKKANDIIDKLILDVTAELEAVSKDGTQESINKLVDIQKLIVPTLLTELKNPSHSLFKTRVLDRFASMINQMLTATIKLREFEIKEEVDINNPKIQLLFTWFIDIIKDSLEEASLDTKAFFDLFSSKLIGWEEKSSKKLSKLSFKAIQQNQDIDNPLK